MEILIHKKQENVYQLVNTFFFGKSMAQKCSKVWIYSCPNFSSFFQASFRPEVEKVWQESGSGRKILDPSHALSHKQIIRRKCKRKDTSIFFYQYFNNIPKMQWKLKILHFHG